MFRILVCGGRDFTDWDFLNDRLYWLCFINGTKASEVTIISGHARGADWLGEEFAHKYKTGLLVFPADWEQHGKAAGPIRNEQMLKEGFPNVVVAFPGGKGTADMVDRAKKAKVPVIDFR